MYSLAIVVAPLMSGELLYANMRRSSGLSGFGTGSIFSIELENADRKRSLIFPVSLHNYCARTSCADPLAIIKENMLLPVYQPFMRDILYRKIVEKVISSTISPKANIFSRPGSTPDLRICPQCVMEDLSNFGFWYVRRDHCLPGMMTCTRHGCMLSSGCERCSRVFAWKCRLTDSGDRCVCGAPLVSCIRSVSPTEIKSAVRISRIIENLNESLGEAKLENVHIGLAFVEKFKECGITNPTELHNRIAESIGGFLADHLVQDISRYGAISYLLAGRSLVPSLSIALNAVIIDCLFDGLKRFVNVAKKMTTVISGARIRDSYLKVLKVIERNCGRTQSEVRSAGGSEFDFLWKIDPKWIRLNIRKGMVIGGNESRRSGDLDEIDEYLLLRMEEKFAILIQDPQYPIKITLGVLVEGCKNNRKLCSLLRDLPRSREFAEAHIDSPESFLVRVVRYRVKNFNGCEEDAIKETSGMMAVPQDLIRRILDESAELVPDQLSRISHLCTKRRINKARGRARLARRLA